MEFHGPPRQEILYFVRYKSPGGRSVKRSRWQMNAEDAERHFAGQWYELDQNNTRVIYHGPNPDERLHSHVTTGIFMPASANRT